MFLRLKLVLFLCSAVAAGIVAGSVWNLRLGLALFFALLAGVCLASLFYGKKEKADVDLRGASLRAIERSGQVATSSSSRTNALLEAMMNGMREGMLVVDEEMRVVASNRMALEIFSGVEGTLETRRLSELTRNPSINSAFIAALRKNEQSETKVEMEGPGGPIYDLRVVPLRLNEENSKGAMGVFFNITRLERLERVRQEFLSNVSHELRTPLTAIVAFVETLEDGAIEDQESNRRFLSIIRKNAERMHNLINDILELSAIEAGTVQVEAEAVPLHALVNDVLTALASRAEARRVTMKNEVAMGVSVFADARRLEQMLTNLVHNAIKFNRENGSVTIRHERTERDRISVVDTGEGVPPEHIKRIFERFYRVDRARSREMGGTGLGLAIVKHLARAHGGEVSVQSTPGEGSTFVIELPLSMSEKLEQQESVTLSAGQ
ncbi:MAG: two-component system, OmpR family, phosphate regulon sensor histidine kinase PhoR [Acidobacteriota bacterium]|jgi:two-component system phosphate regulon sensor histidine kinase PhoR|nr:two-component system, OmpR family, phosphate regulon sensor histidine kinase PhoR [Acidobacteriota bacterium]